MFCQIIKDKYLSNLFNASHAVTTEIFADRIVLSVFTAVPLVRLIPQIHTILLTLIFLLDPPLKKPNSYNFSSLVCVKKIATLSPMSV